MYLIRFYLSNRYSRLRCVFHHLRTISEISKRQPLRRSHEHDFRRWYGRYSELVDRDARGRAQESFTNRFVPPYMPLNKLFGKQHFF